METVTVTHVVLLIAVVAGTIVQGSVGFGFALIVVPTLAMLYPKALPVTVLLLAIPMTAIMALRERASIDRSGFLWIICGRLLGTVAGVGVLMAIPDDQLAILIGSVIIVAVVTSLFGPKLKVNNAVRLAGGLASGIMGTAAAVGGPALGFVYQNRPGPELRSTLAVSFVLGSLMSLSGLALAGELFREQIVLTLQLLPGILLGLWISRRISDFLDEGWVRPAVLFFATTSGVITILLGASGWRP